jgi:hypothetical protein
MTRTFVIAQSVLVLSLWTCLAAELPAGARVLRDLPYVPNGTNARSHSIGL